MNFSRSTIGFESGESSYVFSPREDITAYEIAKLLPILIANWKNTQDLYAIKRGEMQESFFNYEELDELLRRHFRRI